MAVTKKKRFEVFKRDKFACQYCGQSPPDVVLECDHIEPVCEGGSDEYENLITACFDCNRGKGKRPLDESDADAIMEMKLETLAQVTAYNDMLKAAIERRDDQREWLVERVCEALDWGGMTNAQKRSLSQFSTRLSLEELIEAAEVAASKLIPSPSGEWRYFCGVCWRMIRRKEGEEV